MRFKEPWVFQFQKGPSTVKTSETVVTATAMKSKLREFMFFWPSLHLEIRINECPSQSDRLGRLAPSFILGSICRL